MTRRGHPGVASHAAQRAHVRAEPVARDVLERVLEAAITAPSSTNRQPWRFAVVTRPGAAREIVEAVRHARPRR